VLKFDQYSRVVKPYLGIQEDVAISTKEKRNLAEYLARPSVPGDLPFVYKRLFNRDFSIDNRFYISPANSFKMIGDSYDQWSRGISSNVAVIGEKGSGKSTLIRFAEQQYLMDESIARVNLNETFTKEEELLKKLCDALGFKPVSSKDEFIEKVERKKNRSVIVIENIQNIFIRNINGFDALEAFWIIMSSTMDKLFWIVSCSRYSWEFFIKISEADQYFSHVAYTDRLDETEIREAILTRHKSSGYELYFEPDETLKHSRAFKKLLGDEKKSQELVRDQFFSKLSKICEGNTSIAMIFWLQSIKEINSHRFVFQPLEITELDRLEVPSKEVLFTLTALIQHDSLNEQQLALALHQNPSESRLMLARLKTKGIIYAGSNGYHLNHLVYRQVVRILKQRNIIH
jgi:energy-coupling factor transporter ATP-binding protein EcfA2